MSYLLIVLFVGFLSAALTIGRELVVLDAKSSHCSFTLEGQVFNLCPIFAGKQDGWTVEFEKETPPTYTKTHYKISLHKPLQLDSTLPSHEQCPDGTWICMTMSNRRPHHESEPPRILQTVPVAGEISLPNSLAGSEGRSSINTTLQLSPSRENSRHKVLHLRLHGGHYVNQRQLADIQFACDHTAEEPTSPSYYYQWNGTHSFRWQTKHACGITMATLTASSVETSPTNVPEDAESPPDGDTEGDHSELIDLPVMSDRTARSTWMILFSSSCVVVLIIYLVYYPPRFLRSRLTPYLKSHPSLLRFRVGERVLVRWAQEDMELLDSEEDVMVNGERESLMTFDDEEQIPLKPSPRKGWRGVMNYGSAP